MNRITAAAVLLALAATPALAKNDKPEKPAKPAKPAKAKQVTVKGVVLANDGTTLTVDVNKATKHGKFMLEDTDGNQFTAAKVTVADVNADGQATLADVQVGDKVVVKLKLVKDAPEPFAAKHVVDQTHPPADEAEGEAETE